MGRRWVIALCWVLGLLAVLGKASHADAQESVALHCARGNVTDYPDARLIMEGAGVPKITIRAFNRRVDWPQLVSQLVAVSEGDSVKIGN